MNQYAGLLLSAIAAAAASVPAHADTITVGNTYTSFYMLTDPNATGTFTSSQEGGGNIGGSSAVISGVTTPLPFMYCADIFTNANVGATYTGIFNNTGSINGQTLTSVGRVSWLMLNIARTATTIDQQSALQGLMWTLEQPTKAKWDTTNNTAAATTWFNTYANLSLNQTGDASRLWWINPVNAQNAYAYQGFVAATWVQISEPGSALLFGGGLLALVALKKARRPWLGGAGNGLQIAPPWLTGKLA